MTDIVERLRQEAHDTYSEIDVPDCLWWEAADEIERLTGETSHWMDEAVRLQNMKANLHGHIKRLEDENARLRAENAKLREALRNIADPNTDYEAGIEIARAALSAEKSNG